jgi:crotonobetainyl-CoA:carnitine CoA-transferase CaiB-like acyl-CoA transferase
MSLQAACCRCPQRNRAMLPDMDELTADSAGPLSGYRVIDLTSMISGPLATMFLADQGADVIKVENPAGGDFVRRSGNRRHGFSANFLNNNRNKRSLALDLKQEAGKKILFQLVESADVFIQNFRPGVIERMGFGESVIREIRPEIVYVSIAGFGFEGPYAPKPVYDPLIQALSGLATIQAGSDEARPRLVRTIVPDKVSAITAAQAITAALLSRERTGKGQHVRLSMLDAIVSFLWHSDMASQTLIGDNIPQQSAASFIDLIYETADGYMSVAVMSDREWAGLSRAVERPQWLEDERFKTPALRDRNLNARLELIQSVLIERTTEEWLRRLEAEQVPCAPVQTRNAMVEHPQIAANALLERYQHPDAGELRQARPAAQFSATPARIRFGAPRLGQHTAEILTELGLSAVELEAMAASGAVVLDS